jgi:8-oxo-dGTP diphosphatase
MSLQPAYCYVYPHPAVTTDVVVFTIRGQRLEILMIRRRSEPFRGSWALPGGFVDIDEDLEACALRELAEETGVRGVYLEQLYTFGAPGRDPRERVISVAYYALTRSDRLQMRASSDAAEVAWFPVSALPPLAFDHAHMIGFAHRRLKAKLDYSTIAFQFMPETFTLGELQRVYEALLGEGLDKRNFRKRILALDRVEPTGELRRNGSHRPARTYRLKDPGRVEIIR